MDIAVMNLQRAVAVSPAMVRAAVAQAARRLKLSFKELSVVFVGEARMRRINREYLKHDYVTDVITFGHGEIVICPKVALRHARRYGQSLSRELRRYVVHGLLHLAGFDDHTAADARRMRQWEEKLL